jgi:hypothetical protein
VRAWAPGNTPESFVSSPVHRSALDLTVLAPANINSTPLVCCPTQLLHLPVSVVGL